MRGSTSPLHDTQYPHVNSDYALYETRMSILLIWLSGDGSVEYTEERVQAFQTVAELRACSKRMGKIFRNTFDQEDSNETSTLEDLSRDAYELRSDPADECLDLVISHHISGYCFT